MRNKAGRYDSNIVIDDQVLISLYVDEKWIMGDVAEKFGCSIPSIRKRLVFLGVPIRHRSAYRIVSRARNLSGETFGKWKVLNRNGSTPSGNAKWRCQCQCGTVRSVTGTSLMRQTSVCCRSCSKKKGYEGISGKFWYDFRHGALRRGITWSITIEYAWELFLSQGRRCSLSGEFLTLPANGDEAILRNYNASIDRIDSSVGYEPGNIQWVDKTVNLMKQSYSQNRFIEMCKKVAHHNDNNSNAA